MINKLIQNIRKKTLISELYNKVKRSESFKSQAKKLQEELERSLVLTKDGNLDEAVRIFSSAVNEGLSNKYGLTSDYIRLFVSSAAYMRFYIHLSEDAYREFLEQTRNLDASMLPCSKWLLLGHICLSNGLFHAEALVRKIAIRSAYMEEKNSPTNIKMLTRALKASIDQSDYIKAKELLDRLRSVSNEEQQLRKYELYYYISYGDIENVFEIARDKFNHNDWLFNNYINGKSVAVVGPAPTAENNGAEIDSFDVVVRLNYRGMTIIKDTQKFGSRVDVSYYGNVFSESINNIANQEFFDKLDFIVFKSAKHEFQDKLIESSRGRFFYSPNYCFFNGSAHLIQNVLFDILHFSPQRVKLFNSNFFLASKTHYSGYRDIPSSEKDREKKDKDWKIYKRHAHHKYLSSFNFTRNLWTSGLIEVDTGCEKVISMSEEAYMSAMQEIYIRKPPSQ